MTLLIAALLFDGFDHLFSVLDWGDGLFSLTAVGIGLTIGGAVGYATESYGWVTWIPALVCGVLAWFGMSRLVGKVRRIALRDPEVNLVGTTGTAVTDISTSIGEVWLQAAINKRLAVALDDEIIPKGSAIMVVDATDTKLVVKRLA